MDVKNHPGDIKLIFEIVEKSSGSFVFRTDYCFPLRSQLITNYNITKPLGLWRQFHYMYGIPYLLKNTFFTVALFVDDGFAE